MNLLAHKIEIYPTQDQANYFDKCSGSARHLYNQLLHHFSQDNVKWSKKEARKVFYHLRETEFPWYGEISACILQASIDHLDIAFQNFFRRVKQGKKPGYPQFKKKGSADSFTIDQKKKFRVVNKNLFFEKCNKNRNDKPIKLREKLRFSGTPKRLTISKRAGKYYAAILIETDSYDDKSEINTQEKVGVDFGVKDLATLSDGTVFPAIKALRKSAKKLARLQRGQKRKQKTSNRYAKAKHRITKLHKRVSDQRKAAAHFISDYVTKNFKNIALEDLNVSGMLKNRKLSFAISDVGFYDLRRQIEYKARLRGRTVTVVDRFFPSSKTCSTCGAINQSLKLSDRTWTCDCGATHDRDINAAINLSRQIEVRH